MGFVTKFIMYAQNVHTRGQSAYLDHFSLNHTGQCVKQRKLHNVASVFNYDHYRFRALSTSECHTSKDLVLLTPVIFLEIYYYL